MARNALVSRTRAGAGRLALTSPAPTRSGVVSGKPVAVFDDLVDAKQIATIAQALEGAPFTRSEIARPDTRQFRHWAHNMDLDAAKQLPLHAPSEIAAGVVGEHPGGYRAYRAYCNFAAFGDMLFTHTDAAPDTHEMTALWFVTPQWDVEWGGETLLFNDAMDAEFVVSPRPGRLLVFDGRIPHVGRPPNRICFVSRFTFAYKLEPRPGE